MEKKIESIIRELVREYNFERQQEAISHEERDGKEERAHAHTAYTLATVLEKALKENDIPYTRTTNTVKIISKRSFDFVEISYPIVTID